MSNILKELFRHIYIEKGQIKCFNFSFLGWGLKVTYNSDFFEKLRPPPWVFKCPNLNFRLFCFFSDPPPYWGKSPKFSRFLIMTPPLITEYQFFNARAPGGAAKTAQSTAAINANLAFMKFLDNLPRIPHQPA